MTAHAPDHRDGLLEKLRGGDRRSIGRVNEVVAEVLGRPELLAPLLDGMEHPDEVVRMRAADAAEKVTTAHPGWLAPHARRLLRMASRAEQQEVRWHLAPMLTRLPLGRAGEDRAVAVLLEYAWDERSRIVRTFAMQALADLALRAPRLRARVCPVLEELTRTGTPAMRVRGRRLLEQLRDG